MKYTMEDYITILQKEIPSDLLNNEYADCIRRIGRQLPLIAFGFFEFCFGEYHSRVDFHVGIDRKFNENEKIIRYLDSRDADATLKALKEPLKKWSTLGQQLWLFAQYFGLIYDIPDPYQRSITPWYYITYNPFPLFINDFLLQAEIVLTILKMLDEAFTIPLQSKWEQFFNNTSPSTCVNAVGFQANRQVDALRVALLFDKYNDICSFLEKHQWAGDFDDLHRQTNIVDGCDRYGLTIDVNPALQPKIGIECFYNTPEAARKGYKHLTDKLISLGICSRAKQKAFLAWEGALEIKNDPNSWSWPDKYRKHLHLTPPAVSIKKAPKHIKIVYEPGHSIIAKGYLGYHKPLP